MNEDEARKLLMDVCQKWFNYLNSGETSPATAAKALKMQADLVLAELGNVKDK